MSTVERFQPKRKASKRMSTPDNVKQSSGSNSRGIRPNVLLKKRKESPATHYPEMVAPDYSPEEPKRPITPIVEELTRIKERVTEVSLEAKVMRAQHVLF